MDQGNTLRHASLLLAPGWPDRGRGTMQHSTGRLPWLYRMSQSMLAWASVTVWTGLSARSTRTIGHPDGPSPLYVRTELARANTPVHAAGSCSAGTLWRQNRHQRERQYPYSLFHMTLHLPGG